MKKEIKKIVMFVGFMVYMVGLLIEGMSGIASLETAAVLLSTPIITVIAVCFVYTKKDALVSIGYGISAVEGIMAIFTIMGSEKMSIASLGLVVLMVGAVIYLFSVLLKYFGYIKNGGDSSSKVNDLVSVLGGYKELEKEKIISEEEYENLKKNAMDTIDSGIVGVNDLKKWKKMLDQQVITEDEFVSIKSKLFKK